MSLLNELQVFGVDIQDGLKRFVNNAALYEKMLKKFPAAAKAQESLSFLEAGDVETAIAHVHTLKGMTGNLSLTPLFTAYTEILGLLRAGDNASAKALLVKTLPIQEKIIACIENAG